MATARKEVIYWDACVFISWLENKQDTNDEILHLVEKVESGKAGILVSTLIRLEVLPNKRPFEADRKFRDFLRRKDQVEEVAVDFTVIEAAKEIRVKTNISTPDAIHIATANVHGAQTFYTYDEELRKLNGASEIKGLEICKPPKPDQIKMRLE